jgi:hypothetical protein
MEIITTIGVDAHSQVKVAGAVHAQGRVLAEYAAGSAAVESDRLVHWVKSLPAPRVVAVEGAKRLRSDAHPALAHRWRSSC